MKLTIQRLMVEALLVIGVTIALFHGLGMMPLSADEPIRALVAADMAINGNYIAPKLNGEVYLNKPPLYNWMLLGFFKVFNSYSEWVVRLPSILSLLAWGITIAVLVGRRLSNYHFGLVVALAFITSGNLWFYSSYLGHIDVTYSLVTFLQLYALYHYGERGNWWKAFGWSYGLAAVGFMMKGLPSIVFQGISILVVLGVNRSFKRFFSLQHILSGFVFLIPIGLYFWAFSQHYDLELFAKRLFTESSSRTVADKSLLQSIGHLFSFPFIYLMDIMPWGLSVLVFFRKDARQLVWSSSFLRSCIWLFGANIIVYWLSPDYRARYVFMLTPFLLIPSLYALYRTVNASVRIKKMGIWIPGIAFLVALIFGMVVSSKISFPFSELFVGLICMALILFVTDVLKVEFQYPLTYSLLIILVVIRIAYTNSVVPIRIETGPYLTEKTEGLEIARLSKYDQLAMYHSNISLTMNWYITTARNQTLETETSNHNLSSMYLVPTEVIKDTSNVDTYFNFVRRYEQKPFSLVKFKRSFPAMPKKKE